LPERLKPSRRGGSASADRTGPRSNTVFSTNEPQRLDEIAAKETLALRLKSLLVPTPDDNLVLEFRFLTGE
jgi:hypothetical protein